MDNKKMPLLSLGATIDKEISVENFFSEENNKIFDLIKNPSYLRYSGWNMLTLDYPKIKNGESWEVKNGDSKTIRLYEDGTLVAFGDASNEFLGWGKADEEFAKKPILNSLATIEFVYEFVKFYMDFLKLINFESGSITLRVKLSNTELENGNKLGISTSHVLALFPSSSEKIDGDKEAEIKISVPGDIFDAKYLAYKMIAKIYLWFSVPMDKIPYTAVDEQGKRYVDIKSFEKEQ